MTSKLKIAFQGEPGANSHIAILEAYPDAEPLPCATFEDALAAISSTEADLGMIPIENSVAGRVADIHHLLPDSGLFIVGEWVLPIRHQLMAPKGTKLSDIKTVESHVHALGQCRRIIRKLGLKPIVAADTAGSARDIASRNDKNTAAIASRLAALAERVHMAFHRLDVVEGRSLGRHQLMAHRHEMLGNDVQAGVRHQVVNVGDAAGDRILDRDHAEAGLAGADRREGVFEGRAGDRLIIRIDFA